MELSDAESLQIINELADLLVTESYDSLTSLSSENNVQETILPIIDYIMKVLEADKACAILYSQRSGTQIFFNTGYTPMSGEKEVITNFVMRITQETTKPIRGEALYAMMTEEEKKAFGLTYGVVFPVVFRNRLLGAFCIDGNFNKKNAHKWYALLNMMYSYIRLGFRNALTQDIQKIHEDVLMRILDNLDTNIYVSDIEDDIILFINQKMATEYGLDQKEAVGKHCWALLQSGMTGRCPFCPSNDLQKNPEQIIVWEEHSTANNHYYKNTDSAIRWLDGRYVHLQHSIDVTQEKVLIENIENARKNAEEANQAKSEFLSRMSHEIRTPLNAIIGMSKIAAMTPDLSKVHDCVSKIDSSSKQLLALVNDVLDMSKIEVNKMELVIDTFDFEKMLIDVSNVITVRAEEKQQRLHIHMDMNMPRFYRGDEMRIAQVFTNLLSNAVKFTPDEGIIRLNIRQKESSNGMSRIEATVTDTGIGISESQQKLLFRSFEQADGGKSRRFGGTGLGLAISKSIVNLMGGDILLQSRLGEGSTFSFEILLEQADSGVITETRHFTGLDIRKLKVLYLDRDAATRQYFSRIMDSFNVEAVTTANIEETYQALIKAQEDGKSFNIIFLEWSDNPDEHTRSYAEIKKRFGSSIIVLTSLSHWSEIKDHVDSYGIGHYLSKPLFPSTIMNVIAELVGLSGSTADLTQTNRFRFSGSHLLLVEDVEINRDVVCHALEDSRIKITSVHNGLEAVQIFSARPEEFDIILMDINMPEMDGYEAAQSIRALPNKWAREIPILAMTANAFAEDMKKSLDAGMNDHITKPISFDILFYKLHHYLSKYTRAPESAEKTGLTSVDERDSSSQVDTDGFVDMDDALKRLGGNTRVYKTILSSFTRHLGFEELERSIAEKNTEASIEAAHALKGSSGNLSLTKLFKQMSELEKSLKDGNFRQEQFEECRKTYNRTLEVVSGLLEKM